MARVPQPAKFRYHRRSREEWSRAAAGPREIGADGAAWLARVLSAASRSGALDDWQLEFITDTDARFAKWGPKLALTDRQLRALERIAEKLGLAL
jgi:hypothetical protein